MNRHTARRLWGLTAIGAATAVGLTTHDAGFVVITFLGTLLVVPRVLGFGGHGHGHGACAGRHAGRAHLEERMAEWHRQAHTTTPAAPGDAAPVA